MQEHKAYSPNVFDWDREEVEDADGLEKYGKEFDSNSLRASDDNAEASEQESFPTPRRSRNASAPSSDTESDCQPLVAGDNTHTHPSFKDVNIDLKDISTYDVFP